MFYFSCFSLSVAFIRQRQRARHRQCSFIRKGRRSRTISTQLGSISTQHHSHPVRFGSWFGRERTGQPAMQSIRMLSKISGILWISWSRVQSAPQCLSTHFDSDRPPRCGKRALVGHWTSVHHRQFATVSQNGKEQWRRLNLGYGRTSRTILTKSIIMNIFLDCCQSLIISIIFVYSSSFIIPI